MIGRCAALAVAAALGVAASAPAGTVAVDQDCYAENVGAIAIEGTGYTPGSTATVVLGSGSTTAPTDVNGSFSASLKTPASSLQHPGAEQLPLTATDALGVSAATTVNLLKPGVDGVPAVSKPHAKIMWNIAGFPGTKAIYGHWRFRGRTRADHRMGIPQGPCGVLHVKARQIEAKRVFFGTWLVQFDFNRHFDKHAAPRASLNIRVSRTFG